MSLKNKKRFLKDLTIIVPSYNRQNYLIRLIKYWRDTGVKLLILDGSSTNLKKNIKILDKNIKYIHFPSSLYKRLYYSIKLIKTKYVMLGCDDEFYVSSSLAECVKFLSLNKDFVACTGRAISFNFKNNSIIANNIYPLLKNRKLTHSDPNKRIEKHFSNYEQGHLYAVCEAKIWKIAAKTVFSKEYNFYAAWELQFEYLIPFSKKSLVLPNLLWLRSKENEPIRDTSPSMSFSNSFSNWWTKNRYLKEKKIFIKKMKLACKQLNKITRNKSLPEIEKAFEIVNKDYVNNLHYLKKGFFYPIYKIAYYTYKNIPYIKKLLQIIKKNFNLGTEKSEEVLIKRLISSLKKTKVQVDNKEMKRIFKLINETHKRNS